MKKRLLIPILWMSCALYTYPTWLAYFQRSYPSIAKKECRQDLGGSIGMGLLGGPISAGAVFFLSGFNEYGMQWTCPAKEKP